jgi:quercetin dioxygenase-like cupin family protein
MAVTHIRSSDIPTDRSAIETESFTATVSRVEVPHRGPRGWHHHGDHHVIAYLISGKVRIESGPEGSIITEPSLGDLVHIEPGTVHQETYDGEIAMVGFTVGSGPGRVDVTGPDGSS